MISRFKYLIFPLILLFVCLQGAMAQHVSVTAKLDSAQVLIGQQTQLHFFVHVPVSRKVTFPALKDSIAAHIQIASQGKTDTIKDNNEPGMHTIRRSYAITSFDEGNQIIPPINFLVDKDTVSTQPLTLKVITVKVDTTKAFRDIKQPLAVSYNFFDWLRDHWVWVVIVLALIAIAVGITWYLNTRPKPVIVPEAKPVLSAHALALNKLNDLRAKKLWQQNQVKEYHIELTDIIREYIEQRYHVKTYEKTTEEIFAGLRSSEIAEPSWERLRQVLTAADLVKFAKFIPPAAENEQSMDNAIGFVTDTRQAYEPPVHKEGGPANGVS